MYTDFVRNIDWRIALSFMAGIVLAAAVFSLL